MVDVLQHHPSINGFPVVNEAGQCDGLVSRQYLLVILKNLDRIDKINWEYFLIKYEEDEDETQNEQLVLRPGDEDMTIDLQKFMVEQPF